MKNELLNLLLDRSSEKDTLLRNASDVELESAVRAFFELQTESQSADVDRLWSAGSRLQHAGRHALQSTLENWLTQRPNCSALDVVCCFLTGYWRSNVPVSPTLVQQIVDRLPACESSSDTLHSGISALSLAVERRAEPPVAKAIRLLLASYLDRSQQLRLQPAATGAIRRALLTAAE